MRYKNLDNAKWILTLLMVLYHIQFVGDAKYNMTFMAIKNLGDCVVPTFSLISGFLFWSTVKEFLDLKYKLLRRIQALLIPYLLWNFINTFFANWQGGRRGVSLLYINIWDNIVMWNSSPHFWYIFMLMFWAALSPILYILYKHKGGMVILFTVSVAYLIYKGNNVLHSRFIYMLYVWAGAVGFYFPNLMSKLVFVGEQKLKKIVLTTLFLLTYLGMYFIYCDKPIGMGVKVWLYGLRALFLLIALLNLPLEKIGKMTGFKYSFWIFAVHYWLDSFIEMYVSRLVYNSLLYQLITWVIVVMIGMVTGVFFEKNVPVLFKVLSGNRVYNDARSLNV